MGKVLHGGSRVKRINAPNYVAGTKGWHARMFLPQRWADLRSGRWRRVSDFRFRNRLQKGQDSVSAGRVAFFLAP